MLLPTCIHLNRPFLPGKHLGLPSSLLSGSLSQQATVVLYSVLSQTLPSLRGPKPTLVIYLQGTAFSYLPSIINPFSLSPQPPRDFV